MRCSRCGRSASRGIGTSITSRSSAAAPGSRRTARGSPAKLLWSQWSPRLAFDDACFERTAVAFDNLDYVDVVIHSYRHRYGLAEGDPRYAELQRRLAALPAITVPAITLDGAGDGVAPTTDGSASASKFYRPQGASRDPARRP